MTEVDPRPGRQGAASPSTDTALPAADAVTVHERLEALRRRLEALGDADVATAAPAPHDGRLVEVEEVHQRLVEVAAQLRAAVADEDDATALAQLHELQRELVDAHLVAPQRAWRQVAAAGQRLRDMGPVSEVVRHSAREAVVACDLDRAIVSRVEDGWLVAEAAHVADDPPAGARLVETLHREPIRLAYPLIEVEALRRRRPLLLAGVAGPRSRSAFAPVLDGDACVIAPVVLDGRVVGFVHGDRSGPGRPVAALDRDTVGLFADAFAQAVERAVLRRRLQTQRQEMRRVASWAEARTSELSDGAITLADEPLVDDHGDETAGSGWPADLRALLTPREIDVLERMTGGETNATIARALVVSEGTVKFHVKNILRKMQAANRAEATSRYLQMKLRHAR